MKLNGFDVKISSDSHPKEIMLEVSRECNYNCIFCFRRDLENEYFIQMTPDTFNRVLSQALESGVRKFSLSGWGEPLTNKYIAEYMRRIKEEGFKLLLNTNGYYLVDYVDLIVETGVDEVVVSMDAGEEDPYKIIRLGGDLSRVIEGLKQLRDKKYEETAFKPIVKFQFTITTLNVDNILKLAKLAAELKVKEIIMSNVIPLSSKHEDVISCLNNEDCLKRLEEIRYHLIRHALETNINFRLPEFTLKTERRCPFMEEDAIYVTAEGYVAPCIYYAHPWSSTFNGITRVINAVRFGDLKKTDLLSIWRGDKYARFRFIAKYSVMPSCLDCNLEKSCSMTLSNEFDCWGNSPTCSHCPYSRDLVRCPL